MSAETRNGIVVHEYSNTGGGHEWSAIPNDLWWLLVSHLDAFEVNGIGFQGVTSADKVAKAAALPVMVPDRFDVQYEPYHGESDPRIVVFEITQPLRRLLLTTNFDQWNQFNEGMPFDEVVFFSGSRPRIQAVPYENMVYFYDLNESEIRFLTSLDPRFKRGLYAKDMSGLLSP